MYLEYVRKSLQNLVIRKQTKSPRKKMSESFKHTSLKRYMDGRQAQNKNSKHC